MAQKTQQEITQLLQKIQELWNSYSNEASGDTLRMLIEKSNNLHSSLIYLNAHLSILAQQQNTKEETVIIKPITAEENSKIEKTESTNIRDIRNYIGINEKFMFINQLFNGNANEYNIALNQINNIEEEAELETYLTNLENIYRWEEDKKEVAESFKQSAFKLFL